MQLLRSRTTLACLMATRGVSAPEPKPVASLEEESLLHVASALDPWGHSASGGGVPAFLCHPPVLLRLRKASVSGGEYSGRERLSELKPGAGAAFRGCGTKMPCQGLAQQFESLSCK